MSTKQNGSNAGTPSPNGLVRNDYDGPLLVGVEGKELVIRIGVDRLAFCLRTNIGQAEGCKIRSKYALAKDMSAEMERDDGSGGCKPWDFIDQMAVITAENGGAISLPNTVISKTDNQPNEVTK